MKKLEAALFVIFSAVTLHAAPVTPDSYSMPNGEPGNWIYHDNTYTSCSGNVCNTPLANLSGGTGKLTDGILTSNDWFGSGQPFGTSVPWVGWNTIDPTITFYFSGLPNLSQIAFYFDNTPGNGDVRLPESIEIAGTSYSVAADGNFGPRWVSFNIPSAPVGSVDVTIHRVSGIPNSWVMLGEVAFATETDAGAVPEPGTVGLLALGMVGIAARRYYSWS